MKTNERKKQHHLYKRTSFFLEGGLETVGKKKKKEFESNKDDQNAQPRVVEKIRFWKMVVHSFCFPCSPSFRTVKKERNAALSV